MNIKVLLVLVVGCVFSCSGYSLTTHHFKENSDLKISLSDSNYSRLVVKGDKITQVHFPEGMMAVRNDPDGAVYVMVAHPEPFTMFVSTELGRHFSLTVNTEAGLGKTFEFIADGAVPPAYTSASKILTQLPAPQQIDPKVTQLMTSMLKGEVAKEYAMKRFFGKAIRWGQGISLFPKYTYSFGSLKGEVTEIYNGSNHPLELDEAWFNGSGVKAVVLSKSALGSHERAMMYRVAEIEHA
jgi:conjugal transfer pilus assembly protein TraK